MGRLLFGALVLFAARASFGEPAKLRNAFTDDHLQALMKQHGAGIVYAWSPHMPMSIDGIATVRRVAKAMKVEVFMTLDPHASGKAARLSAARMGWSNDSMKRLESVALFRRGMGNHYPVLIVFSKGKLVGPLFPGLKSEGTYTKFIAEQLER